MPSRRTRKSGIPWRRAAAALLIALGLAAAYAGLWNAPLVAAIEGQTLGWRFHLRGPVAPPPGIAILAIDDRTIGALKRWPLPRRALAEAVERLDAAGAAVIGLDLLLLDLEQPTDGIALGPGDQRLRAALRRSGRVVLGMAFTFGPSAPMDDESTSAAVRAAAFPVVHRAAGRAQPVLQATGALVPIAPLREAARLGQVNVLADEDGVLRHLHLAIGFEGDYVPAFPVEVARRFLGVSAAETALLLGRGLLIGDRIVPADPMLRLAINYYGGAGTIPTHSMIDLLEGRIPAESFAGRVVLVGATALGAGDSFVTPFSRTLPGVEVLATAVGNIVGGEVLARTTETIGWDVAAILLLGLAGFAVAHLPSPALAALAALALLGGWAAVAQLAFEERLLWLNVTFPALAILLSAIVAGVGRTVAERRLRRDVERQRRNLSRYHSPLIADLLAENDRPGFEEREQPAAILFVDLRGFTGRSERMTPADTAHFLRDFHRRIERAALTHGGILVQFTGDGAMVIFGMSSPGPRDAAAALACARDLAAAVRDWSRSLVAEGRAPLAIGVGIHYGPVVITRLGGQEQLQLTAAGDTVNVANRLEALTKIYGATFAVSGAVVAAVQAAGRDDLLAGFAELPEQPIRGREGTIPVWVAGEAKDASPPL